MQELSFFGKLFFIAEECRSQIGKCSCLKFVFTGSKGIGHKTEKEKMKVLMKRFLVPDNELNMLSGTRVTSGVTKPMMTQSTPRTDKSGTASTTTEAVLTDKEKASKLQE